MWRDRAILFILLALLGALQYRLWFGKNSIPDYLAKQQEVQKQHQQNTILRPTNVLQVL